MLKSIYVYVCCKSVNLFKAGTGKKTQHTFLKKNMREHSKDFLTIINFYFYLNLVSFPIQKCICKAKFQ